MVLVLVLVVVALVAARWVMGRRAKAHRVRDDLRRVGDGEELAPRDAALRAQGRAAWTRFIGGGGL